jgi:hypothetical protein
MFLPLLALVRRFFRRPQNAQADFWLAQSGWDGMRGGPDRWVTWGCGDAIGTVLSLGGGPEENQPASARATSVAIMLWCNYCG